MTPPIQTNRLEIKAFSPEDLELLRELLVNDQIKQTFTLPDFSDSAALDAMAHRFLALSREAGRFVRGIFLDGRLIGFVNDVEIENGTMELGYVIHPAHWGRGYATEMLTAVLAHLLGKGYHTIKTGAFAENLASLRVMEKAGMVPSPQSDTISYRGVQHTCRYYEAKGAPQ